MKKFVALLVLTLLLLPSLHSVAEAKKFKSRSWRTSHRTTYYRTYPRRTSRRRVYRPGPNMQRGRKLGIYKHYNRTNGRRR